jgi:hypothetical protein
VELITLKNHHYTLKLNKTNGQIEELYDKGDSSRTNLVLNSNGYGFGRLFETQSGQDQTINLSFKNSYKHNSGECLEFTDESGKNGLKYILHEDYFQIDFYIGQNIGRNNGQRKGIEVDFNFVNSPGTTDWQNQIIPSSPYWENTSRNGFYLMSRPTGRYVVLVFSRPISCWRLKYSNFGHHLLGFQILLKVEDLEYQDSKKLPEYEDSSVRIAFASCLEHAYGKISELGDFPVVYFPFSGGLTETTLPVKAIGKVDELILIDPLGKESEVTSLLNQDGTALINLGQTGKYQLVARRGEEEAVYSLFIAESWKKMLTRVSDFGVDYFQLPEGCFARAVDSGTRQYKRSRVVGGYSFGKVDEEHSCGSGEFGGFLCWSGLKRMLQFGTTPKLLESAKRYFFSWALQGGATDNDYFPNAISPVEQEFRGLKFSPGHLYREQLYIQHEGWFLEEFCDYFLLTGDRSLLKTIEQLALHLIAEHQDASGALINVSCHNNGVLQEVDYTTCATPVLGLIRAGKLLNDQGFACAEKILNGAEKACDHLVKRGLSFPTETIPEVFFIDEGSIACTALTLIYGYLFLKQKQVYRQWAEKLLRLHDIWIIRTPLCSLYASSFRYWENSWETQDWGPSINGGHGWTIWGAAARYYNYFISRDFTDLVDSFAGFVSNMPKLRDDGAMYSSFTPDYITGGFDHNGYQFDLQYLAHDFPRRTLAASGSYFLIRAGETWFHTSALGFWQGRVLALNGVITEDAVFRSYAPGFRQFAVEKGLERIELEYEGVLEVIKSRGVENIKIIKGRIVKESRGIVHVEAQGGRIILAT